MHSPGSVATWLGLLEAGDARAAQHLWDRYFAQLVRLARARLAGVPRRVADEEDVALSAFASFCREVEAGRFPRLSDPTDLWRLLVVITARKAARPVEKECRLRRGRGQVRGDSALSAAGEGDESGPGMQSFLGPEPTPDFAAQVAEEYQSLLAALNKEELRSVAVWKMEGYTNEEIADKLGCSRASVERKLRLIRHTWEARHARDEG
jgi:DNA-directed RNA polymerase specialized sigma24 family protein